MTSDEIRSAYLDFFKSKGHAIIPPAPLVPPNDSTTLFTPFGMQQMVPYLKGEPHPMGKRLVDSQPCFRADDIDEVGDNRHTTFFEMLGNWSLGDYFKEEQLNYVFEFLTDKSKGLGLNPQKLFVSVFDGDRNFKVYKNRKSQNLNPDVESIDIWKRIFEKAGIEAKEGKRIFPYSAEKNWWSRSGIPENMPIGEIGGPDSEIFYDFGLELKIHENSVFKNKKCHPNCDCGRFLEIGNSVFMQYKKIDERTFEELPKKNVDFGGGLERLVAACQNTPDIFQTDAFLPIIQTIEKVSGKKYVSNNLKQMRIIADHLKASTFMIIEGIIPSNKLQGYILRRLLRRAMFQLRSLESITNEQDILAISDSILNIYQNIYFDNKIKKVVHEVIGPELFKFKKSIEKGTVVLEKAKIALKKIFNKAIGGIDPENLPPGMVIKDNKIRIDGNEVFKIYETYGLHPEIAQEIMTSWGVAFDEETMRECNQAMEKHSLQSRTASAGMFKAGLADHSETVTKLHTATHLLHAALRQVLGSHVRQEGSNITSERLRFDFSHPQALTPVEISKVEALINQKINQNLPVVRAILDKKTALQSGALAFFKETYPDKVSVYTIGNFSKELCSGPHVDSTAKIGSVKIVKQESIGAGKRRLYAVLNHGTKKPAHQA